MQQLDSYQQLVSLPKDTIDRNIIPFARSEFENLIETFGNVHGPNVLKNILTLQLNKLENNEIAETENLIKTLLGPNQTVYNSPFNFANSFARSLFCLVLLQHLQDHYLALKSNNNQDELAQVSWIPAWTKKFSAMIKNEIVYKGKVTDYQKTKSAILGTIFFYVWYYFLLADRDKDYKILTFLSLAFAMMILTSAFGDKLNFYTDNYLNKKSDHRVYGYLYDEICKLIDQIEKRNFQCDINNDENVQEHLKLLFLR